MLANSYIQNCICFPISEDNDGPADRIISVINIGLYLSVRYYIKIADRANNTGQQSSGIEN